MYEMSTSRLDDEEPERGAELEVRSILKTAGSEADEALTVGSKTKVRFELQEPVLRPVRRVAENRATGLALGASRLRARALSPDVSSSDQSDEDSASKVNIILIPHTHTRCALHW